MNDKYETGVFIKGNTVMKNIKALQFNKKFNIKI